MTEAEANIRRDRGNFPIWGEVEVPAQIVHERMESGLKHSLTMREEVGTITVGEGDDALKVELLRSFPSGLSFYLKFPDDHPLGRDPYRIDVKPVLDAALHQLLAGVPKDATLADLAEVDSPPRQPRRDA